MDSETSNDQLNSKRVRQMAALRRSAYRSRSYSLVAFGGCLGAAAEFIFDAVQRLRRHAEWSGILIAIAYFAAAVGLFMLSRYFIRLASRFHHEAKKSILDEPVTPPDFSKLQDGSQIAQNLEDM